MMAIKHGDLNRVRDLIPSQGNLNVFQNAGLDGMRAPLELASRNANLDIVQALLDAGAEFSPIDIVHILEYYNSHNPINAHAIKLRLKIIKLLIEKGADASYFEEVFGIPDIASGIEGNDLFLIIVSNLRNHPCFLIEEYRDHSDQQFFNAVTDSLVEVSVIQPNPEETIAIEFNSISTMTNSQPNQGSIQQAPSFNSTYFSEFTTQDINSFLSLEGEDSTLIDSLPTISSIGP